jgi:choline dehydrogenase-like flavoprotein
MRQERRLAALTALCNAFIPSVQAENDPFGYYARSAGDQCVPQRMLDAVGKTKAEDRVQFDQLLDLVSSPLLGLTWMGPLKPAHALTPEQRVLLLQKWADSPIPAIRNAFATLKKLTAVIHFGDIPPGATENPNWPAFGYRRLRDFIKPDPAPLPVFKPEKDGVLTCDVLIIGSGAGGSIVAAELAAAGQEVIVVDKGAYTPQHEFTQEEFPALQRHFEAGGLLTSSDGAVTVLAGSALGGGTTINWAGSLRTPDYVLEEWAKEHGNPHFTDPAYQRGFEIIEKRNGVSVDFQHDPQNEALLKAAQSLGLRVENIPMNMRFPENLSPEIAWKAAGFSCYGDAFSIKQGAVQTFLRDAGFQWAKLLADTEIEKINIQKGIATGATAVYRPAQLPGAQTAATPIRLEIRAKKVIVCAGSLHTPVLLLKSGLRHPHIGRNLFLHPVAGTAALMPGETLPWYGPMMSVIVQEFARLDGNWGARIECPPQHPGLAAFSMSWEDGLSFKQNLSELRRMAVHICLTRDRFGGQVTVGKKSGQPLIHYTLSDYDRKHLVRALQESLRLHHAAGAERVSVMHNQPLHYFPASQRLEDAVAAVAQKKWTPNRFGLFSAHQMGTCRMGGGKDYPVKPDGEAREVRNLYVADGSLFPSASGTNPMLSIQALAHWLAQGMKG